MAKAPAVAAGFAPALPAVVATGSVQRPQPADGPVVTASLAQPAAPAGPPLSAAPEAAPTRGSVKAGATASTDCLPAELRAVIADLAARFGDVSVVSTHQLNTVNHSAGSIREKLHQDCKAVDIRADRGGLDEIKAYLRTRREVGGLESYRNGIIHIDVSGTSLAPAPRPRSRTNRAQAAAETGSADAVQAALPAQAAPAGSPFTPVVPERYR